MTADTQEVTSLQRQAQSFVEEVGGIAITDGESYEYAGMVVRNIAGYMKRVGEVFDPICAAADHAHKVAVHQRDELLKPAKAAKTTLGIRMAAWEQEQARIRREAEEAARRERERLEREAREQAQAETRRLQQEAEDRRLASALDLEARGDVAGAEHLLSSPIPVPTVVAAPVFVPQPIAVAAPKLDGVSYRDDWDFELVDPALVPREFLIVDDKKVRGVVKAMRNMTNIPGVRAFSRRAQSVKA